MRCPCGSEWWLERREIKPAAGPALDPRMQTMAREVRYRLVCASCGTPHGETTTETPPKRGRKAKTHG